MAFSFVCARFNFNETYSKEHTKIIFIAPISCENIFGLITQCQSLHSIGRCWQTWGQQRSFSSLHDLALSDALPALTMQNLSASFPHLLEDKSCRLSVTQNLSLFFFPFPGDLPPNAHTVTDLFFTKLRITVWSFFFFFWKWSREKSEHQHLERLKEQRTLILSYCQAKEAA